MTWCSGDVSFITNEYFLVASVISGLFNLGNERTVERIFLILLLNFKNCPREKCVSGKICYIFFSTQFVSLFLAFINTLRIRVRNVKFFKLIYTNIGIYRWKTEHNHNNRTNFMDCFLNHVYGVELFNAWTSLSSHVWNENWNINFRVEYHFRTPGTIKQVVPWVQSRNLDPKLTIMTRIITHFSHFFASG